PIRGNNDGIDALDGGDVCYGFYIVKAAYFDDLPDGFMTTKASYRYTHSSGLKYERPMTKLEVDAYRKYKGKKSVEIQYGIELVTKEGSKPELEFTDVLALFRIKEDEKILASKSRKEGNEGDALVHEKNSRNIKLGFLNSNYGITAQHRKSVSGFTNLILAAYICAYARVYLWGVIQIIGYENWIAGYTDSVHFFDGDYDKAALDLYGKLAMPTKAVDEDLLSPLVGENLGMLEEKHGITRAFFVMNGIYVLYYDYTPCKKCKRSKVIFDEVTQKEIVCPRCYGRGIKIDFRKRGHPNLTLDEVENATGLEIPLIGNTEPNTLKEQISKCRPCPKDGCDRCMGARAVPADQRDHDSLEEMLSKIGLTNKFDEAPNRVSIKSIQEHLDFGNSLTFEDLRKGFYFGYPRDTANFWYATKKSSEQYYERPTPKNLMSRFYRVKRKQQQVLIKDDLADLKQSLDSGEITKAEYDKRRSQLTGVFFVEPSESINWNEVWKKKAPVLKTQSRNR
ncbi:MAG: SHOCT domain-containing protein, partial [Rhabdochlamydiaceae bacterium]